MDANEAQPHHSHSVKHIPVTKLTAIDLDHYSKIYSYFDMKVTKTKYIAISFQHLDMSDKLQS